MKRVALLLSAVLVFGVLAEAQNPLLINGAGATFPYPIYSKWFDAYHQKNASVQFNYQQIGSGAGIKQATEGTVDFGASDGPMTDEQISAYQAKRGAGILHFPTVLGAVVPTYNIPGVSATLNFTPEALAGIYLGKITKWNDPALTGANKGVNLPAQDIVVIHRSEGSGTTYIWTDFLSKTSPEWAAAIGTGKTVPWPTGMSAYGNERVAGQVKLFPDSIGYAQLTYGLQNALAYGAVENREGAFIEPLPAAVTAAADASLTTIPADLRFSITDAPGKESYPISATTWAIVYVNQPAANAQAITEFLRWVIHEGQQFSEPLQYAPLPPALVERAERQIGEVAANP